MLGKYINMKTKIKFRHELCGYEWKTSPDNFLRTKEGCPKCARNKRETTESYATKINELTKGEYEALGEYVNARTPIKTRHNVCGYEWCVTPYSLTGLETRCPKCNGGILYTTETYVEKLNDVWGGEYELLEPYINQKVPRKFLHKSCGNTWVAHTGNLLRGSGCPECCYRSKGEELICEYLDNNNYKYHREFTFNELYYKSTSHPLRFDFFLPDNNIFIEYDGIQHFKPKDFFGGEEAFKNTKHKDEVKNNFAKEKGIKMVRIPYNLSKKEVIRKLDKILIEK